MAIIKILGILDILAALIFWMVTRTNIFQLKGFLIIVALFLLVKGIIFATNLNVVSILDIVSALIILLGTNIILPRFIVVLVFLYLLQKGIFSLMG